MPHFKLDGWYSPGQSAECADGYHLDVQVSCPDVLSERASPRVRLLCHLDADHDDDAPCGAVCVRDLPDGSEQ